MAAEGDDECHAGDEDEGEEDEDGGEEVAHAVSGDAEEAGWCGEWVVDEDAIAAVGEVGNIFGRCGNDNEGWLGEWEEGGNVGF